MNWESATSSHKLASETDALREYVILGSDDAVQIGLQKDGL